MWRCIAIVLLSIWAGPAGAQEVKAIDCNAARSAVENLICADSQLASLNQDMSGAYSNALRAGKVDAASQAEWLKRSDAECAGDNRRECLLRRVQLRIATLHSAAGAGPSFGCDKARSAQEYAICTDPALAQLDLVLANAYRHARDTGKADRTSQAEWLRRRDAECRAPDQAATPLQPDWKRADDLPRCLSGHMQQRLSQLQDVTGFAYGNAMCSPDGTISVTIDIPPVPAMYLQAEYTGIFPNRLFTWRCEPNPRTSITVKYGFEQAPRPACGMLSIWENGIKVARQVPIGQCGTAALRSARLSVSGLTVCYWSDDPSFRPRCDRTARTSFPTTKDPYFVPGACLEDPNPAWPRSQ